MDMIWASKSNNLFITKLDSMANPIPNFPGFHDLCENPSYMANLKLWISTKKLNPTIVLEVTQLSNKQKNVQTPRTSLL